MKFDCFFIAVPLRRTLSDENMDTSWTGTLKICPGWACYSVLHKISY